jgi:hypothetical protein
MIIHTMKDRGIHAAALQETWAAVPSGRDNEEIDGFLIIWHGETVRSCTRGRLGVVIILSPVARLAWEAGGELVRRDREGRVMTVDLALEGKPDAAVGLGLLPNHGRIFRRAAGLLRRNDAVFGGRGIAGCSRNWHGRERLDRCGQVGR